MTTPDWFRFFTIGVGLVVAVIAYAWLAASLETREERRTRRNANRLKLVRREPVRFEVPPLRMMTETKVRCLFGHDALMSESDYTPDHGWICARHLEGEHETAARESYGSKVTA